MIFAALILVFTAIMIDSTSIDGLENDPPQKRGFLSATLGSNMVLHRAPQQAVLWGFSIPKVTVVTNFNGKNYTTMTNVHGVWRQKLPPTPASSKPYTIVISASTGDMVKMENVLFGDVFLCSGQSNMQYEMGLITNSSEEIQLANLYPLIRLFTVGQGNQSDVLFDDLQTVAQPWQVANNITIWQHPSNNAHYFSAVCWFFGRTIFDSLGGKIPIGLVSSNWGATSIEHWANVDAYMECNATEKLSTTGQKLLARNESGPRYNAMINPFTIGPMAITGFTWYQGERNTGPQPHEEWYGCLFPAMIKAWRKVFVAPDAYFGFVQLSTWCNDDPMDIPLMRAIQMKALALPKVGYSTMADHGAGCYIHPPSKQYCGIRLGKSALALQYGKNIAWRSPTYNSSVASFNSTSAIITVTLNDVLKGGITTDIYPFNYIGIKGHGGNCTAIDAANPNTCAWASVQVNNGSWINATISTSKDRKKIILTVPQQSNSPPLASSYGWGAIPLMSVYDRTTNLPVLAWKENVSSIYSTK